jgi:mannose-6-phosphate isomerase-like protein (cupin superfamily)
VAVTDRAGAPIGGATITALGPVEREVKTAADGTARVAGLRAGTYRIRFAAEGYFTFEKEIAWRAGQPAPDVLVALTAAPPPPPPPPPLPTPTPTVAEPKLPPPGLPKTMSLPGFIEGNFISAREPYKESVVGCSGVGQAMVWQVREPWESRRHPSADAMLYVVGGEGTLRMNGTDSAVAAGSFAVVPRGTTYSLTRRGRNPLVVLAVLSGAPCAAE